MNGPPGKEKAAEALPAPTAAHTEAQSTDSIGDDDEARKFAELQDLAIKRGYSVRATGSGFVMQRGTVSVHSGDLMALRHALVRMGKPQRPARGT